MPWKRLPRPSGASGRPGNGDQAPSRRPKRKKPPQPHRKLTAWAHSPPVCRPRPNRPALASSSARRPRCTASRRRHLGRSYQRTQEALSGRPGAPEANRGLRRAARRSGPGMLPATCIAYTFYDVYYVKSSHQECLPRWPAILHPLDIDLFPLKRPVGRNFELAWPTAENVTTSSATRRMDCGLSRCSGRRAVAHQKVSKAPALKPFPAPTELEAPSKLR